MVLRRYAGASPVTSTICKISLDTMNNRCKDFFNHKLLEEDINLISEPSKSNDCNLILFIKDVSDKKNIKNITNS